MCNVCETAAGAEQQCARTVRGDCNAALAQRYSGVATWWRGGVGVVNFKMSH